MASKKSRGGNHHVYGVHAVRSLLEKRPEAILDAKILRGSKAGSLPELARYWVRTRFPSNTFNEQRWIGLVMAVPTKGSSCERAGPRRSGYGSLRK